MTKKNGAQEWEVFDRYEVTYVFELCCVVVNVLAKENATLQEIEDHSMVLIKHHLDVSTDVLLAAQDIVIELNEKDIYNV